ncbi:hypothetical protein [Arcanobacterium canis]
MKKTIKITETPLSTQFEATATKDGIFVTLADTAAVRIVNGEARLGFHLDHEALKVLRDTIDEVLA